MRISVLVENGPAKKAPDLIPEFGLSLHVDTGRRELLFDTGSSGVFADNAATMGIDIRAADHAVLSHHHSDHGGGLARFLAENHHAEIFLRPSGDRNRTFRVFRVLKKNIGIDTSLAAGFGDRFRPIWGMTEIAPDVFLLTDLAGKHARPKGNRHIWIERNGRLMHDDFDHELVMVLRSKSGLVILTGCSHSGILNIVEAATTAFPSESVAAVIGGFHLVDNPVLKTMAESREEIEDIARALLHHPKATFYTGHCTGPRASAVLENIMGDRLQPFVTGTVIEA